MIKKILTERIKFSDEVHLREVTGDPYIFLNLRTYKLVIIPVKEKSKEKYVLSFVVEKLKKGTTFKELSDSVSGRFTIERDEVKEGLKELIEKLATNDMLKVGDQW